MNNNTFKTDDTHLGLKKSISKAKANIKKAIFILACKLYAVYVVRAASIIVASLGIFTYVYSFAISSYEENMQVINELKNFDSVTIGMFLTPIIALALFIISFFIKPTDIHKITARKKLQELVHEYKSICEEDFDDGIDYDCDELEDAKKQFFIEIAIYSVVWVIASIILTKIFINAELGSAALLFGILIGLYLTGVIFAWKFSSDSSSIIVFSPTLTLQALFLKLIVCMFLGIIVLPIMLHKNLWNIAKCKAAE